MAKILLICSGFSGILNSSFELIQRLQAEGHGVTYTTLLDTQEKVEKQGFRYLPLAQWHKDPVAPPTPGGDILKRISTLLSTYINAKKRRAIGLEQLGQAPFLKTLDTLQPDLVLIDIECHEYIFTTYVSGHPLLLISQWFNGQYAKGLPLISTLMIPQVDNEKIEDSWRQRQKQFRKLYLKRRVLTAGTDRRSLLLYYANQIGFPLSSLEYYNWPSPFTFTGIPILHFTDETLELPHKIPANHHYLGPMVFEKRQDYHPDLPSIKNKLSEIYAKKQVSGSKLIYCSVSTMAGGNGNFLQKVIEACAHEPNWILVIALGGHPDQLRQQELPDNTFIFSWLPQLEVLRHTDCSLNHAGINTINECIICEVPMVLYSGEKYDQNGCAVRMAYHQLGVMGDRKKTTPILIHQDISEVLNNPIYKEKVANARERSYSKPVRQRLIDLVNTAVKKNTQSI